MTFMRLTMTFMRLTMTPIDKSYHGCRMTLKDMSLIKGVNEKA